MNGADIIFEVSRDLNDQEPGYEYLRWSKSQLQSYLKEALTTLSRLFKDQFQHTLVVRVEPGGNWQKACNCSEVVRVVGEATAAGQLVRYLYRQDDVESNTWGGPVMSKCHSNASTYEMESYSVSSTDKSMFRVYPPVPAGVKKYVNIECFKAPTGDLEEAIPDEMLAAVKQWMLYRALMMDSENNPTIASLAEKHYQTYEKLINFHISMEDRERLLRDGDLRTVRDKAAE